MAPAFKLTYFPVTALAEPIRWLLAYGGIEYEDERFDRESWPQLKVKMPFGQVPVLTANGKQYHQSISIARFFGKQVKLAGANDWESLEIDIIVDTINDLRLKIAMYHYEQDAAIKQSRKEPLFSEAIPYALERLDKIAKENNGHFALKKLTWADVYFASVLDYFNYMVGCDLIGKYPNLQQLNKNVVTLPAIKKWIETRPKTDF